jgi:hypothetical protein
LKGEYEALEKVNVAKRCGYHFQTQQIASITQAASRKKSGNYGTLN